jgi:uncharacterized protein (TIGR03435 family)
MAWTKTVVTTGLVVLLLVAVVVVKLAFFPSIKDANFTLNIRSLQQAPANVVIIRLTHFPKSTRNGVISASSNRNGKSTRWMMGRNVPLSDVMAAAYGQNPSRVALPPGAPKGNYDFLVTVADNPEEQLQSAIRRKLGYTAQMEKHDADVLALKIENATLPGLTVSDASEKENVNFTGGKLYFTHMRLTILTDGLQQMLKTPVVDKTGLTNFYDFYTVWNQQMQNGHWDQAAAEKLLNGWGLGLEPDTVPIHMLVVKKEIIAMSAMAKGIMLGPPDPGAERGFDYWYHGTGGGGYLSVDDTDPATGINDFTLGNTTAGRENHADWRSLIFGLGPAAAGAEPITFSFSYKLPDKVSDGDNLRVQLRFYDKATNFLGQKEFWLGSNSHDSEMAGYKKMAASGIHAPSKAQVADVTFSANFYDDDHWTSGTGRFDDLSVMTVPRFPFFKVVVGSAALLIIGSLTALFMRYWSHGKAAA